MNAKSDTNLFGYKRLYQLSWLCFNEQIYIEMVDQPKICDMRRKRVALGGLVKLDHGGIQESAGSQWPQPTLDRPRIRIVAPSVETCVGV